MIVPHYSYCRWPDSTAVAEDLSGCGRRFRFQQHVEFARDVAAFLTE
jgi:hypothetical protein